MLALRSPPKEFAQKTRSDSVAEKEVVPMDVIVVLIILLLLFGGGGGLYWGMGAGWGIGPIGLIIAVLVIAFLLNGRRGRGR